MELMQLAHYEIRQAAPGDYVEEELKINIPPKHVMAVYKVAFQHQALEFSLNNTRQLAGTLRMERDKPSLSSFLSGQSEHVFAGFKVYTETSDSSNNQTFKVYNGTTVETYTVDLKRIVDRMYYVAPLVHEFDPPLLIQPRRLWFTVDSDYTTKAQQVDVDIWYKVVPVGKVEELLIRRQFA